MGDITVYTGLNENNTTRGLHIVVINPSNGRVSETKVFDTYKTCKDFDEFVEVPIPSGFIIIAACKDDCSKQLSEKGK